MKSKISPRRKQYHTALLIQYNFYSEKQTPQQRAAGVAQAREIARATKKLDPRARRRAGIGGKDIGSKA
jgi:hypothetical protein